MSTRTAVTAPTTTRGARGPSPLTYMRLELRRTLRNRRLLTFTFGFPLVLFLVVAGPQRHEQDLAGSGIPAVVYFMSGLAAWGTMTAMIATGARIAAERQSGWQRQLRITPLSPARYLGAKVAVSYAIAVVALVLMYAAGIAMGAHVQAVRLVEMTLQILVGLLPFAALGVFIGHKVTADSVGPLMGGGVAIIAFLSGTWFPLDEGSTLYDIGRELPSYWLVQAGRIGTGAGGWPLHGWIVLLVWSVLLWALALRAFRRDTARA
jgi:ABC-2 type transport system permease protein